MTPRRARALLEQAARLLKSGSNTIYESEALGDAAEVKSNPNLAADLALCRRMDKLVKKIEVEL